MTCASWFLFMTGEEPMAQVNVKRWQGHLEAAARAGMSIARYAREHGLSAHTLYAAKQTIESGGRAAVARRRAAARASGPTASFVPVRLAGPSAGLVARLPNGTELCFGSVDEANLGAVLGALAGLACSR
jgi:hypothetical protein